jgi:citrate lyase subunit beta/citryl-CoA lyase
MRQPTTYLFVPGDRPERFDKAIAAGAGATIFDLEDAVTPDAKAVARDHIRHWCAEHRAALQAIVVRINDAGSEWFDADLALLRDTGLRFAMLPKAERVADIARCMQALGESGGVIPIVETVAGLYAVDAIAAAPGVVRLAFGTLDYIVDAGLSGDERGLILPASRMALASRMAGIAPPIAGVTTALGDESQLAADIVFARAFGFGAKLCIHPRQVAPTRAGFAPTAAEIDWARRVIAAVESGHGAVQVDGKMVDRPVVQKARAILEQSG